MGSPSLFHLSITLTIVLAVLISFSCSTGAIKGSKNVFGSITNFRQYFEEEIRYRRSSYEQYRDDIKRRVWNAVENFRHKKTNQKPIKKNQLDFYVEKYYKLYNDTLNEYTQRKQQLKNVQLYERPNAIDNSLEDFKKFYNASIFNQLQIKAPAPKSVKIKIDEDSFTKQLEQLQLSISANWESILTSTKASAIKAEEVVKNAMVEFEKINSEINVNSNLLEDSILHFPGLSKEELKAQAQRIEEQIAKVDRKGSEWIEDRIKTLDLAFKSLQEKVKKVDAMYDQLVGKRQAGVYYTYMNDKTLKRVLEMIDETDDSWSLIRSEGDIHVYRKFFRGMMGSQFACVRCSALINASPQSVFELFKDNNRIKEYNTLYDEGRDLEVVAENTKVSWASSPPIFPLKARDFCTIIHFRKLRDGTMVVLNRATKHPDAPLSSKYVRASIILGANIIQPVPSNKNQCRLTMITQVDPGGFAPPMIVNHVCTLGPIGFVKNVEKASQKKPS